jgi:hypothetical protein
MHFDGQSLGVDVELPQFSIATLGGPPERVAIKISLQSLVEKN